MLLHHTLDITTNKTSLLELAFVCSTAERIVRLMPVFLIWPQDYSWKCRLVDSIWEALRYQIALSVPTGAMYCVYSHNFMDLNRHMLGKSLLTSRHLLVTAAAAGPR